eukprot:RCo046724
MRGSACLRHSVCVTFPGAAQRRRDGLFFLFFFLSRFVLWSSGQRQSAKSHCATVTPLPPSPTQAPSASVSQATFALVAAAFCFGVADAAGATQSPLSSLVLVLGCVDVPFSQIFLLLFLHLRQVFSLLTTVLGSCAGSCAVYVA